MEVAELPVVVAGFVAIILGYALYQMFGPLIRDGLSRIPGIGGPISRTYGQILDAFYNGAIQWINASIWAVANTFGRIEQALAIQLGAINDVFYALVNSLWHVTFIRLPFVADSLRRETHAQVSDAYLAAVQHAETLFRYAEALVDHAMAVAANQFQAAVQYTQAAIYQEIQQRIYDFQRAAAYAESLAQNAIAAAYARSAEVIQYAQLLYQLGLDYTRDRTIELGRYSQDLFLEGTRYAERLAARDIEYTQTVAAATAEYSLTLVRPLTAAITDIENSPCMRFCNPLGNFGRVIQELENLGVAALFIALAAEMAHDPQGSAQRLDGAVGGLLRGVLAGAEGETGYRPAA